MRIWMFERLTAQYFIAEICTTVERLTSSQDLSVHLSLSRTSISCNTDPGALAADQHLSPASHLKCDRALAFLRSIEWFKI